MAASRRLFVDHDVHVGRTVRYDQFAALCHDQCSMLLMIERSDLMQWFTNAMA